jgi:glycosyltransferase involved in cell wall biosynthesis
VKVAIVTQVVIGERLAGPAIRALAMARVLAAAGHDVLVHSTGAAASASDLVADGALSASDAGVLARRADVVVVQGDVLSPHPELGQGGGVLVSDLYDPFELEGLVQGADLPPRARYAATRRALHVLSAQLERADLFLCASERQRLFWLGHLDAAGRVNPATNDADPTLATLLAIVPFGIEDDPPERDGPGLRGTLPGLDDASRIVLWGGGVYDWLDPLPVIEATGALLAEVPDLRLVFMGTAHPNPAVPVPEMLQRARSLVAHLDIEHAVVFHEGWVPYAQRHNVLLDAEVGVSGHLPHVEALFAYRTRILDYVWCGLPTVTTAGDALGDVVTARGLGAAVPPGDTGAVADALRSLLLDDERAALVRSAVAEVAPTMRWTSVLQPLVDLCADPRPAADRDDPRAGRLRRHRSAASGPRRDAAASAAVALWEVAHEAGLGGVAAKVAGRARRLAGRAAPVDGST